MKEIIDLVQDDDKIREERKKAKKNRDKYVGIDSEFSGSSRMSSGFSDFKSSSSFNDLDSKDWRSSNPSFKDRISDITSKVKNIIDNGPEDNNNDNTIGVSDDEAGGEYNENKNSKNAYQDSVQKDTTIVKKTEIKVKNQFIFSLF